MAELRAWHGSAEVKEKIVARMKTHREADDFIRGEYQRFSDKSPLGYRGCAIGCALDKQPTRIASSCDCSGCIVPAPVNGWHNEFAAQFGILAEVASLIDDTYESLEAPEHSEFAVAALEAIPVGADLNQVFDRYYKAGLGQRDADLVLRLLSEAPVPEESTVEASRG